MFHSGFKTISCNYEKRYSDMIWPNLIHIMTASQAEMNFHFAIKIFQRFPAIELIDYVFHNYNIIQVWTSGLNFHLEYNIFSLAWNMTPEMKSQQLFGKIH
jgi:hypothetical protein